MMKNTLQKTILASALMLVVACTSIPELETKAEYPMDPEDRRRARAGKLTGEGGIKLFGRGDEDSDTSGANVGIGINSYLWRATLDTLSFMPFASADPFGGVIITDWYEDSKSRGERFKVNVIILDSKLHVNAIKVSVFRQVEKNGQWRDAKASQQVVTDLENKILTRARELRVAKESKK